MTAPAPSLLSFFKGNSQKHEKHEATPTSTPHGSNLSFIERTWKTLEKVFTKTEILEELPKLLEPESPTKPEEKKEVKVLVNETQISSSTCDQKKEVQVESITVDLLKPSQSSSSSLSQTDEVIDLTEDIIPKKEKVGEKRKSLEGPPSSTNKKQKKTPGKNKQGLSSLFSSKSLTQQSVLSFFKKS